MGEIATSNRELILFYNPNTALADDILAYAAAEGLKLRVVNILKTPFTGTQLEELADKLKVRIDGLVNKEDSEFIKQFGNPVFSNRDWIKVLEKNPKFLKYPIAIKGDKTIFVKTPSLLTTL